MVIAFDVNGYPPAKNEAMSMLGPGHSHAPRVLALLTAARDGAEGQRLGSSPLRFRLLVRCKRDHLRSDATNYLGGIADVLEDKHRRGELPHLGDLARVSIYDNDRQIEEIEYRWEEASEPSYRVEFEGI